MVPETMELKKPGVFDILHACIWKYIEIMDDKAEIFHQRFPCKGKYDKKNRPIGNEY